MLRIYLKHFSFHSVSLSLSFGHPFDCKIDNSIFRKRETSELNTAKTDNFFLLDFVLVRCIAV